MDVNTAIAYVLGLLLLYLIAYILYIPLKLVVRLVFNAVVGGLLLLAFNYVGKFAGLSVAINPITALVAGFLGIPGVVLIVVLQYLMAR